MAGRRRRVVGAAVPVIITAVTPLTSTFPFEREPLSYCFVRVDTDDGLVGYGEACDSYGCSFADVRRRRSIDRGARAAAVGQELDAVEPLADACACSPAADSATRRSRPQARSAVEIALWDLARPGGRALGVARCSARCAIASTVYASSVFLEEGDAAWHHELLEPAARPGRARWSRCASGPSGGPTCATLAELRGAARRGVELMVDGSEIFTLPTALEVADALADLGVMWFEEPLPQNERAGIEELAAARRCRSPTASTSTATTTRSTRCAAARPSVLQPDASTCGGIAEARRMAATATYFGARVVPHVCAGPISLAANLHVAASCRAIRRVEYPYPMAEAWTTFAGADLLGPTTIVDGTLAVPDRPGLGVDARRGRRCRPPVPAARPASPAPDRFNGDR